MSEKDILNALSGKVADTGEADDLGALPEQMGGWSPPPQPGTFRFALPAAKLLTEENFEEYETEAGKFLRMIFNNDAPLTITQAPKGREDHVGEPFLNRLSTQPRKRGKGDDAPLASDAAYLIRALGETDRPSSPKAWAACILKHAGEEFTADIEWSWYCNPKRNIYTADGEGGRMEVEDKQGCKARYYQDNQVKKGEEGYPLEIDCGGNDGECGALVRAFANLTRFKG